MPVILEVTPGVAAHLHAAITRYQRSRARDGVGVPAELEAVAAYFARVYAAGSSGVTGGQGGSVVGPADQITQPEAVTPSTLLTRSQAASRLQVSVSTLKRREKAGDLKATRHGRTVRYRVADLDALTQRKFS